MPGKRTLLAACLAISILCSNSGLAEQPVQVQQRSQERFFEQRIRPVLHQHCYSCHSRQAKTVRGGLLLDSRQAMLRGGDGGPAIVPGEVEKSLIIAALRHDGLEMPPDGSLPAAVVEDFVTWIEQGAYDPRTAPAEPAERSVDVAKARDHWAFQPIGSPAVPELEDAWIVNPIDAFVLAKLSQRGWKPAPPTDKHTWIRRATFDLIGLPPSEDEINAFVSDDRPGSFARVVDRLLASPHYGQRWGRHWLDLVRYADTNGADENHQMPNAWRYRDWVIRTINRDLPLDAFIIQQLAGDLLPAPEHEEAAGDLLTATGMLVLGPKMLAEQDKQKMIVDIVDEQIDTVSRTMLGITIACARCHDHKFDPISTEDYYALAGIFASTRTMLNQEFVSKWMERDLPSVAVDQRRQAYQPKIDQAKHHVDSLVASANDALRAQLGTEMLPDDPQKQYPEETRKRIEQARKHLQEVEKAMPTYVSVMAVSEDQPRDMPVHIRGDHLRQADHPTKRGVPAVLQRNTPLAQIPSDRSGRMQLARWLTSPDQALTPRVMANRIWMWHFGQPLMRSPSNFGFQSSPPVHRELLDWLAKRLVDDGWSLKRMHRTIMLSRTYQMSSGARTFHDADPDNEYLWRQNRRRLEVEPLRDAILIAGDSLDRRFGGAPEREHTNRRAVYLSINRAALTGFLSTFDYVETANHIEQRPVTTVPGQALFLLNSELVHKQSESLARKTVDNDDDDVTRIKRLWLKLYGRYPHQAEVELALRFLEAAARKIESDDSRVQQSWATLCRTLIAGSRFSYVD